MDNDYIMIFSQHNERIQLALHTPENDSKSIYGQNTQVGYRKPVFLDSFMVFGFCYLQYYSN